MKEYLLSLLHSRLFTFIQNINNDTYYHFYVYFDTKYKQHYYSTANYAHSKSTLVTRFGEVMRKLWSPYNFKSIVSPQELIQVS